MKSRAKFPLRHEVCVEGLTHKVIPSISLQRLFCFCIWEFCICRMAELFTSLSAFFLGGGGLECLPIFWRFQCLKNILESTTDVKGCHQHDFERKKHACKAKRVDTLHSQYLYLLQTAVKSHTNHFGSCKNNMECDNQFKKKYVLHFNFPLYH